jgi:phosphohistidine phosphatase
LHLPDTTDKCEAFILSNKPEITSLPPHSMILIRHGEAESSGTSDHARELTAHGRAKARLTAGRIIKKTPQVDLMIVSDATRTRQTAAEVAGVLNPTRTTLEPELYHANTPDDIASIVTRHARSDDQVIAVIGHNPVISEFASALTGDFLRV